MTAVVRDMTGVAREARWCFPRGDCGLPGCEVGLPAIAVIPRDYASQDSVRLSACLLELTEVFSPECAVMLRCVAFAMGFSTLHACSKPAGDPALRGPQTAN